MKTLRTIQETQAYAKALKRDGKTIGLVPTMGYLHAGHLSLIDKARAMTDAVVVSIFVNPTQFGPNEDLSAYPRDLKADLVACASRGADAVFAPEVEAMYFADASTFVNEEVLSRGLCGKSRPTHFRGVCTVVAKLFNIVLPDVAVFGQKDAQQALIIKRMVRDLCFPVNIVVCPIVRETDGLAMSSRNKYLTSEDRRNALVLNRSLAEAKKAIESGAAPGVAALRDGIREKIAAAGGDVDYVEILHGETLTPPVAPVAPLLIAVAARFGKARLIDNVLIA